MPRVRRALRRCPLTVADVSSSYLKTEAQTWMSRSVPSAKKTKRKREDGAQSDSGDEADGREGDEDPVSRRLVVHLGSEFLRVGRATDLLPMCMPCALARRFAGARGAPAHASTSDREAHADEALSGPIESIRNELRAIMRQYKLRTVNNGPQSAASYNAAVEPERVHEHNDVLQMGWVEPDASDGRAHVRGQSRDVLVGQEALRLAPLSPADRAAAAVPPSQRDWRLFRPVQGGLLNVAQYVETYGPSAAVQALLGDLQTILTHALSAPTSPAPQEDGSPPLESAGLGIPAPQFPEHSVLLVVPDSFSRSDLRALGSLLLTQMGFSALCVQTEGVCTSFGAGLSTACVVDIGAKSIGISCVEEGLVLPESRVALNYGGQDVSRFFGEVLRHSNFPYHEIDASARLADAALLDSLKERLATLRPNQVGLNIYDFHVWLPGAQTRKYALRVYDEPILAGLMLFHPDVLPWASKRLPRRPLTDGETCHVPLIEEPIEKDSSGGALAPNPSLGGDEATELGAATVNDVAPTLAMLACIAGRLPPPVAQLVGLAPAPPAPASGPPASSPAPVAPGTASSPVESRSGTPVDTPATGRQSPSAPSGTGTPTMGSSGLPATGAAPAGAAPAGGAAPLTFASLALRSACAANMAAQAGVDVLIESGKTPLDRAVFHSLLASTGTALGSLGVGNEERLRKLANNIVCIGGSARLAGLGEALEARYVHEAAETH